MYILVVAVCQYVNQCRLTAPVSVIRLVTVVLHVHYYPGVLFSIDFFVCLFISFFVSLLARLRENGWTDLHETFREGVE